MHGERQQRNGVRARVFGNDPWADSLRAKFKVADPSCFFSKRTYHEGKQMRRIASTDVEMKGLGNAELVHP